MSKYGVISGRYFSVSGLNMEIHEVNIRQNLETYIILKHLKYSNFGHAWE